MKIFKIKIDVFIFILEEYFILQEYVKNDRIKQK